MASTLALLAACLLTSGGPRVALLVSDDVGLPNEQTLRFTGADAERLASVLTELGGFAPADVHVLRGKNAGDILDELDAVRRGAPPSVFLFYYSGHADLGALHPAGTLLQVDLLVHRLHQVPAELRIGVLDACQSGSVTGAKGSRSAPAFDLRLNAHASSGDILISSSALDEQSFEAEFGGLFTLHWTAGLRGAADRDGDGQVTLAEAYEYAYAQTLRATLLASTGPQHPTFRFELAGRRDPVLTRLAGAATVTFHPGDEGEYILFDEHERSVIAEFPTSPGQTQKVALRPGRYLVHMRGVHSLRVGRIELTQADSRELSEHQMQEVPLVRLSRKGSLGERWGTFSLGQYFSGLGPQGLLLSSLGVEWEQLRWLFGLGLQFSTGDEVHQGLTTQSTLAGVSGAALYSWRKASLGVRLGPTLGAAYLRQALPGRALNGTGILVGGELRVDVSLFEGVALVGVADGRILGVRLADAPLRPGIALGGLGLLPWTSYQIGIRVAF